MSKIFVLVLALMVNCALGRFSELVVEEGVPSTKLRGPIQDEVKPACWKRVEYRGFGHLGNCTLDEERQMGFCYKTCATVDAIGEGPVCFDPCPSGYNINAGAICCADKTVCTEKVIDLAVRIPYEIAKAAMDEHNPAALMRDIKNIVHDMSQLAFPECDL